MDPDTQGFWQMVENAQETNGPFVALAAVAIFSVFYFGGIFLAAWAISATIGTNFWMTALSVFLVKIVLD